MCVCVTTCDKIFFEFHQNDANNNKHKYLTGTRSAPREIVLDNSILQSADPSSVRVSTPPRVITLSEHHFPSASEDDGGNGGGGGGNSVNGQHGGDEFETNSVNSSDDRRMVPTKQGRRLYGQDFMLNQR